MGTQFTKRSKKSMKIIKYLAAFLLPFAAAENFDSLDAIMAAEEADAGSGGAAMASSDGARAAGIYVSVGTSRHCTYSRYGWNCRTVTRRVLKCQRNERWTTGTLPEPTCWNRYPQAREF